MNECQVPNRHRGEFSEVSYWGEMLHSAASFVADYSVGELHVVPPEELTAVISRVPLAPLNAISSAGFLAGVQLIAFLPVPVSGSCTGLTGETKPRLRRPV